MTDRAGRFVGPALRLGYLALLVAGLLIAAVILITAGMGSDGTLGYDYRAYDLAVDRLLAGQPMYDTSADIAGPFGLFLYPPPFAVLVLPITLLPEEIAIPLWTILLVVASAVAIAILPVSRLTRLVVLLLASLSWPLIYAIKLGQVGPILLLAFAAGWRWMDRPWRFAMAAAVGTVVKLQPAIVIAWAAVTGRRRAALLSVALLAALSIAATFVTGPASWLDMAAVLGRVNRPIDTPHSFGIGRLAFEAGLSASMATLVHWANLALVLGVVAFVVWRGSAVASYQAVVVASQLTSPVLWDHYALILLIPVAWLLERRRWWAAAIPLATSTPLLLADVSAPLLYPISFWAALLGVALEGLRERRLPSTERALAGAASA